MKKFMVVYIKILIEFFLHSNPCSNRPVLCEIFIVSYRTCNIQIHYETAHLDMLFLIYISEGEKIAVLKMFSQYSKLFLNTTTIQVLEFIRLRFKTFYSEVIGVLVDNIGVFSHKFNENFLIIAFEPNMIRFQFLHSLLLLT
jgi:hypothetical protein